MESLRPKTPISDCESNQIHVLFFLCVDTDGKFARSSCVFSDIKTFRYFGTRMLCHLIGLPWFTLVYPVLTRYFPKLQFRGKMKKFVPCISYLFIIQNENCSILMMMHSFNSEVCKHFSSKCTWEIIAWKVL